MKARSILIIEDEHALGTALSFLIRRMGHLPTLTATATAGLNAMSKTEFAAVVLDIGLPDMSGLEFLKTIRKSNPSLPVMVVTAHATLDHAIDSQKSGATAYLTKPLDLPHFEQTLAALLASQNTDAKLANFETKNQSTTLIGAASCLRDAFLGIARACSGDVPALIWGPSGSGKSLAASVIHAHSHQSGHTIKILNCSTIGNASEFNHLTESFSVGGSHHDSPFGTLVFDEICDLSPELQCRLATWLATPQITRPRILATTTQCPREALQSGMLREDLFYILSALVIPLPPLRERSGDIQALSEYFIGLSSGRSDSYLTAPALAALQAYPWPGNIRELRHTIDCALAICNGGPIFLSHLPPHIASAAANPEENLIAPRELDSALIRWLDIQLSVPENEMPTYDLISEKIESIILHHLLAKYDNRPTRLASALRMHRATLRQKLRRSGLQRDDS